MRALLFINDLSGGGATLGLAKAMATGFLKNDDITVFSIIRGNGRAQALFEALPNVRVINLFPQEKLSPVHLVYTMFLYPYWVFRIKPHAIFLSLPQANLVGRLWAHVWPVYHATIEHNTRYRHKIFTMLLPWLSFPIKMVLSDTQATLATAAKNYPFRRNLQQKILPLYVPSEELGKPKKSVTTGPLHIMSAGRLMSVKNFVEAIQAVALLIKQGRKLHYTIYGEGSDRPELETVIRQYKLAKHVTLAGFDVNWQQHLPAADIYLQPSHYEGLCITVLEAMQAGIPIIASPVGGLLDYGTPHETYEPVPAPRTAPIIAEALLKLIDNPTYREKLAVAAQGALRQHFNPRTLQAQYSAIRKVLEVNP